MMVVSEIGEQWSPKIPPPKVAAIIKFRFASCTLAIGIEMASMIANVPQEVPVEKAINEVAKNTIAAAVS